MSAKEVKFGDSARHRMVAGVNILADAVKKAVPSILLPSIKQAALGLAERAIGSRPN